MSWNDILNAEIDPEEPITSYMLYRFRDNLEALAKRLTGAWRVQPPDITTLSGSGNWAVPAGVTRVKVRMVGGGGGGYPGGGSVGAGGGGAGYAEGVLAVSPGGSIAYTAGSGGTTGGGNGAASTFSSAGEFSAGGGNGAASTVPGTGGVGSGSEAALTITGGAGIVDDVSIVAGSGGASHLSNRSPDGAGGLAYGGGGGFDVSTGFAGAAGTIILEY